MDRGAALYSVVIGGLGLDLVLDEVLHHAPQRLVIVGRVEEVKPAEVDLDSAAHSSPLEVAGLASVTARGPTTGAIVRRRPGFSGRPSGRACLVARY